MKIKGRIDLFAKKETGATRILPTHVAVIMDGNGRWAKKRHLPRTAGHAAGSKNFKDITRYANKIGIKYFTVYAFSTENWKRPAEEVKNIMNILRDYLKDVDNFKDENISMQFIGDLTKLDDDIRELIANAEEKSKNATGMHLNIALNYGGRDEIVHAVKKIAEEKIPIEEIDEQTITDHLYTKGQPDPDFIIRPSGEYRLSNFLIWQSAYAEYWFSDILWPDFKPKHFEKALSSFAGRNRRFGGIK